MVPSIQIENNSTTYTFTPVRTALNENGLDTYIFDASEAVKSFMGLPPVNILDTNSLTKEINISISATGATTVVTQGYCSYGYLSIGESDFTVTLENGTLDTIYRYTYMIYYYKKATTEGVLNVKVGDVLRTYGTSESIWNKGVRMLILNSTQIGISGTMVIDFGGTSAQSFEQVKLPIKSGYVPVMWLIS